MRALVAGAMLELRNGMALEILQHESTQLFGGTIDGSDTLTLTIVGRHAFEAVTITGERLHLLLVCFEPEILPFVFGQLRCTGHGGDYVTEARARRVVRSLVQTDWFCGTLASLTGGDGPERSLSHHGA